MRYRSCDFTPRKYFYINVSKTEKMRLLPIHATPVLRQTFVLHKFDFLRPGKMQLALVKFL